MSSLQTTALKEALRFYLECGVDEVLDNTAADRFAMPAPVSAVPPVKPSAPLFSGPSSSARSADMPLGKSEAQGQSASLAAAAKTLDELRSAIAGFEGLSIKKTATNMVFCDGNANAPVMLVGEAPGADEDRQGKPFVGVSGQLLDKILGCIGLDRQQDDPLKAIYISNIINWRPPGNRTPNPAEIVVSLPFIQRHIELVKPKILILCGGVSAKALLGRDESISKLRKGWHDYKTTDGQVIPAIATYHPAYLLRTPTQKRAVWADMLSVQEKRQDLNLLS
ncbi:MAG: uracil-DNA glycosylase [Alphaproteobacteria bacterium]|nr:uracil-DNA glycosylase [Alphaproteobacteria bacterium]